MAVDLLSFGLATGADKPAVICGERCLTFSDVHHRAAALVRFFRGAGLVRGDRVALLAKNEIQYLEIQVACMRAGVILVPINFRLATPEVAFILSDAEPGLVIVAPEFVDRIGDFEGQSLVLGDEYEQTVTDEVLAGDWTGSLSPISIADDCTILYTSGTTGRPKGAVLTNRAMFARLNANLFEYQVKSTDIFLQCLPLFHIASNVTYSYAYAGATNVFLKDFHPLAVQEHISLHGVTAALLVPTMIDALIRQPELTAESTGSLKQIAYGASPIPPALLKAAIGVFHCDFLQLYGMTETSAATVLRPVHHDPAGAAELLRSAGQAALGMETMIVDDYDEMVSDGEVGEIVCRGEAVMRGYWNNKAATDEVLKEGWMHTGDVGYRNAEGFFFITDRKKDMIVSGAENVYPREVEDVLFEHPDVAEVAIIGVPDEKWGERVHAVLVAEPGRVPDPDDVLAFARTRLAGYKVPRSVEMMAQLPRNATGKVLKNLLREPYWSGRDRSVG